MAGRASLSGPRLAAGRARVAAAQSAADPPWLESRRGGVELAGTRPVLVRAFNVLRQYTEFEAARLLAGDGWPVRDNRKRWRLGELTLDWSAVAP